MNAEARKDNITPFPAASKTRPDNAAAVIEMARALTDGPDWVKELRAGGVAAIERGGLPAPKLERWKYSNLPGFTGKMKLSLGAADIHCSGGGDDILKAREILAEKAPDDMPLWHLSNAFLRDGIFIDVPAGQARTAHIDVTGHDGKFSAPRFVFRLGAGAELTVIEYHTGEGAFWTNSLTQVIVGPDAKARHYRIQDCPAAAAWTQNLQARIERGGSYDAFTLTTGAGFSRNEVHAALLGEGAECHINGAGLLQGTQLGDTTVLIEHKAPRCASNQFFRNVLRDRAHGVFQGKVHVHQNAQQTDGYQLCNSLLLSEGAEMDTKPELEIYADDVKCSHGATTGQIEDAPLFYLRSRGLDEDEARNLLIEAFLNEAVEKVGDEPTRHDMLERARRWLKG
jgi:Fe-S cluster assembly protein SufD